ncbi:RdRP-domain-containing protein [Ceratobasidium sp. AG-I]|nr:RdRP-domain-containing protein [Ceratobasidium sp. AG-I]
MVDIEFSRLPAGVSQIVFQDAIFMYVRNTEERPRVVMDGRSVKHIGGGYLKFPTETAATDFMAKLKVQPIIFNGEQVKFSDDAPAVKKVAPTPKPEPKPKPKPKPAPAPREVKTISQALEPRVESNRRSKPEMNLKFKSKSPRDGRQRQQRENVLRARKLAHRLSELGQHLRLEKLEFGVLREFNFSPEYERNLIDEGGWLTFEDDEKTLRISIGPTQSNPIVISVAIAIQTVEYVALGTDSGLQYVFLELLQNPRFEKGDTARPSTGNQKEDARHSRNRQSSLDADDGPHSLVAPFASRWLKVTFFQDPSLPDLDRLCLLAGLPIPDLEPQLSFKKQRMYSQRYLSELTRWLGSGKLPWDVAFQCEALYRNGTLAPPELLALRPAIEAMLSSPNKQVHTRDALIAFRSEVEGAGTRKTFNDFEEKDVVQAFNAVLEQIEKTKKVFPCSPTERSATGEAKFTCHYVKITPTGMYLAGPLAEQSNRIIRRYPGYESNFLRVSFTDESDGRPRFDFEVDTDAFSAARFGSFLKKGFSIGGRHFAFLGYSQSGFRDHSCFFSSDFKFGDQLITPGHIRSSLGEFSEKVTECPALYGARMSQAFSSTLPSIVLNARQIQSDNDLTFGNLTFSDGCGRISRELAGEVWESLLAHRPANIERHPLEPIPAVYQIRIGGSKGVVRVDPKLQGKVLHLRPSMTKFQAPNELTLEIARAFETPTPCLLNRPLVMLLSTGGVEASAFRNILSEALDDAVSGLSTFTNASQQLRSKRLGRPFRLAETFDKLSNLGLELSQGGIRTAMGLEKILNSSLYHIKLGIKHKARIPVPGSYTLVGVCDEDKYLLPKQIYACVQEFDRKNGQINIKYLSGKMLVTRSPVIHPGDAQILYAIGKPPEDSPFAGEGNHLPNCVVFSSLGRRPVPNMLGGGDLDGDIYNLILLPELIPRHIYAPARYPEKPDRATLDRPRFVLPSLRDDLLILSTVRLMMLRISWSSSCATMRSQSLPSITW